MNDILNSTELKMKEAIAKMDKRLINIRAGRANPSILDGIMVSYYGTLTPLKQLAVVSVPEARELCIKPYDKSSLKDVEKAIFEANIGLTPNNNGETIILNIPALTEETRREYVKQAKQVGEDAKVILRNIRQDANNSTKHMDISEDEKKGLNNDIQTLINKYNEITKEKLSEKEKELLSV